MRCPQNLEQLTSLKATIRQLTVTVEQLEKEKQLGGVERADSATLTELQDRVRQLEGSVRDARLAEQRAATVRLKNWLGPAHASTCSSRSGGPFHIKHTCARDDTRRAKKQVANWRGCRNR